MFERSYIKQVRERLAEKRRFIQVIMGPRQVGKTTLINQVLKTIATPYLYQSADGVTVSTETWIEQVWESARLRLRVSDADELLLVIDEVQKIPNWSELVKLQWDNDTLAGISIKVVLLGSSRTLIQRGLSESLAGRFEILHLGHWSYPEMQLAFGLSLEQYIFFGGYPGAVSLIHDEVRWRSYIRDSFVETSISSDILMLTRVDKPSLLRQLFDVGCTYSGQIVSFTKIMGQLHDAGNTTTLSHYLQLLSESGLLGGLSKYAGNIIRKRNSSPKFQVFNNALMSTVSHVTFDSTVKDAMLWGRWVESAVGAHLINCAASQGYNLYYWRDGNNEVDYILERGHEVVALEVKSGAKIRSRGMKVFTEQFKPKRVLMVGSQGIALDEFLSINPMELF